MNDALMSTQTELTKLQIELKALANKKLTLDDVRRVLRDCVLHLSKLKDNLATLILFFSMISRLIDAAVKYEVAPFKSYVQAGSEARVDGKLLEQLELENIYSYALNVAAHFELYVDIANMYIKANDDYITPGFKLVDEMARIDDKETVTSRTMKLSKYSQDAQQGIRNTIRNKTNKLIEGYGSRIKEFENALADPTLPQLPPEDQDAIVQGAEEAQAPKAVRDRHQGQLAAVTNDGMIAEKEQVIAAEKMRIQAAEADDDGGDYWNSD
ncbi:uncharacterized protein BJX67DRAFT_378206 [Aspergillus lucknowensis]|uniref:Uncharacterized protein n=1 Tax=Aspergillus lucknowensis TaxID=176173 RepID=A0ABR4M0B4_9EURO